MAATGAVAAAINLTGAVNEFRMAFVWRIASSLGTAQVWCATAREISPAKHFTVSALSFGDGYQEILIAILRRSDCH